MNKIKDMENYSRNIRLGFLVVVFLSSLSVFPQSDWKVSEAKAKVKNPVQVNGASLKDGKIVYRANCKACHGDPGKDNGIALVPKPTDMANAAFLSANSDGEIFAKMTEGKITMPSFKAVLSDDQRWNVVNYIRSFDPNKKEEVAVAIVNVSGLEVNAPFQIDLEYGSNDNLLTARVLGTTADGKMAPAADLEVGFFIKRYFGGLLFGEVGGVTAADGIIHAEVPADLPGGEEGVAQAYVNLVDFPEVEAELEVPVKSVHFKNILEERSLWAVSAMAPWWLIITYFGLLLGAWGTLAYVVLQLVKIKKAGA